MSGATEAGARPGDGSSTKLVAVLGSATPPGRFSKAVEAGFERVAARGIGVELIDLADTRIEYADGRPLEARGDDSAAVCGKIAAADAVIFATPVYRASFTGILKNLLDLLPIEALQGKPCGIVAMGATAHHYLGAAAHLREVLAWFGALQAPTAVYLTNSDFTDGSPGERALAEIEGLVLTLETLHRAVGPLSAELGPAPLAAAAVSRPATSTKVG